MFNSIVEAVFYYAKLNPGKLCIADDYEALTYQSYANRILNLAVYFQGKKLKQGDTVVIEAQQRIHYLAVELALQLMGGIFVPVEQKCSEKIMVELAQTTKAKMIIAENNIGSADIIALTYIDIGNIALMSSIQNHFTFPNRYAVSEILFSTGTTGKKKGIVLTHENDLALAENVVDGVDMKRDNIEMIPSPLNHSHGLRRYYANIYNGSTVILLSSIVNIKLFFDNLEKYHVNSMDLVPSALSILLQLSKNKLENYKEQIRYIQLGSAPISHNDKEKIGELLPNTKIYNFYGSTESGCICINNFNVNKSKENCIGTPTKNAEIIIVDQFRNEIKSSKNSPGYLTSRGKMNMSGYWLDEDETKKVMGNGFIYSNDIAYYDEDGDIILLGRKGDIINVGGEKVVPDEIEDAVKIIPEVEDCAVVPVADRMLGSVPKLFVQVKKGMNLDIDYLQAHLKTCLESYKIPVYIEKIDKVPRTYNGKIQRRKLL